MTRIGPVTRRAVVTGRKTTDQSFVDATAVDVAGLSFSIGESASWQFEMTLFYDSTTTNDIRFSLTAPAGATVKLGGVALTAGATSGSSSINAAASAAVATPLTYGGARAAGAAALMVIAVIRGTVTAGATSGTVQLQARKSANTDTASPADDATVYADSTFIATRMT